MRKLTQKLNDLAKVITPNGTEPNLLDFQSSGLPIFSPALTELTPRNDGITISWDLIGENYLAQ